MNMPGRLEGNRRVVVSGTERASNGNPSPKGHSTVAEARLSGRAQQTTKPARWRATCALPDSRASATLDINLWARFVFLVKLGVPARERHLSAIDEKVF